MPVKVFENYHYYSPTREVASFVTGDEFYQLANVVGEVFPRQLAASFWNLITEEDMALSWVNRERGSGVGFVLVRDEDLRKERGQQVFRRGLIFPELALIDANGKPNRKPVQQLTFHTGSMAIDGYTFPADVVVDRSSKLIAANYELVNIGRLYSGINVNRKNSIGVKIYQDGDMACFIEAKYSKEASQRIGDALGRISLYGSLSSIS